MARRRASAQDGLVVLLLAAGLAVFGALAWLAQHPLVLIPVVPALAAIGWYGLKWIRARRVQLLRQRSHLAVVDQMTGQAFEAHIAQLLSVSGWEHIQLIGGRGDGGADILAHGPDRIPYAIQCKRQNSKVPVGVIRQLVGTVAHEHRGRAGMIVTNSWLTAPASQLASGSGIVVMDRSGLASWMDDARRTLEESN